MTTSPRSFASRVVLVVGATSGIGMAAARQLATQGDTVALLARDADRLRDVATELGPSGTGYAADITDADAVHAAVGAIMRDHGRLDAVVSTSQVMAYGRVEEVPKDVFDRVVDVAVAGTANLARAVLPVFRRQGSGTLVVVNSLLGEIAVPGLGAYVAAKWGQLGLVRTLQLETRDAGTVHVCLVSPGAVDTPIYDQAGNWSGRAGHPPAPVVSPERVAAAVLRCLERPRRHVEVGPANTLTVLGFRCLPRVYDRMVGPLARLAIFRGPSTPRSAGNVFEPVPQLEQTTGGWTLLGLRRGRRRRSDSRDI